MPNLRRLLTCLAVLALAAVPAAVASAPARRSSTTRLVHNLLPGLDALPSASAPGSRPLRVGVALAHPHPGAEAAYERGLQDPASPDYHRFLTPSQYAWRFGVDGARFAAVLRWLRADGLRPIQTAGARDYVEASGTVGQVQRRFATQIRSYSSKGVAFVANDSPPAVPASLGIVSVVGLNTLQRFSTPSHGTRPVPAGVVAPAVTRALGAAAHATGAARAAAGPNIGILTPRDLWSIYDQPDSATGAGQSMAIFGEGQTAQVIKDLAQFEREMKLPTVPIDVVHVPAQGDFSDSSGDEEWDIDSQASTGMAPNARREVFYFGQSLVDADVEATFSTWVSDPHGPPQANASFGECETTPANSVIENPILNPVNPDQNPKALFGTELGNNLEPVAEATLRQATIEGRTLFASTGDTGSSCPVLVLPGVGAGNGVANQGAPIPNYPAASPHAVAVGGTVLYSNGATPAKRFSEYAWPFTGGGQSLFITAPDYQHGVPNLNRTCISTPSGSLSNRGQLCRGLPDVAAQSGDVISNGYSIVAAGKDSEGGGTSLSSPLWVGMWTRIQGASHDPHGNGFANESIYRVGKNETTRRRDFFDITAGTNGFYTAQRGWDYVSGFGSPDVANLIRDIDVTVARAPVRSHRRSTHRVHRRHRAHRRARHGAAPRFTG